MAFSLVVFLAWFWYVAPGSIIMILDFHSEASEGEHADLLRDVLPAARGSQLLEALLQPFPHGNDSGNENAFGVGKALAAQLRGQILLIPASEDISTHLTSRPSS